MPEVRHDLADDYWCDRPITDLAWFLATGVERGVPKANQRDSIEELHVAYLSYYIEILEALIRVTFIDKRRPKAVRITEMTRLNIYRVLRGHKIWKNLKNSAKEWLTEGASAAKKDHSFSRWCKREFLIFLRQKGISGPLIDSVELFRLRKEFSEVVAKPEEKRRHEEDVRSSVIAASGQIAMGIKERAALAKSGTNREVDSPELKVSLEYAFYLDQRRKMPKLGDDEAENCRIFERTASKIWDMINDSLDTKGKNFLVLLKADGDPPSKEFIASKLRDCTVAVLGG